MALPTFALVGSIKGDKGNCIGPSKYCSRVTTTNFEVDHQTSFAFSLVERKIDKAKIYRAVPCRRAANRAADLQSRKASNRAFFSQDDQAHSILTRFIDNIA